MSEPTDFVYNVLVVQRAPSPGDDYLWVNRHQITADSGLLGDEARLNALATAFATFHAGMLYQQFAVDRVVVSTYGPDLPWPAGFGSVPGPWTGQISTGYLGGAVPLELCLFVRRNVTRGRDGKFFLRGALGYQAFDQFGNLSTTLVDYFNVQASALLQSLQTQDVQMVMASGPVAAIQTRQVLSLQAVNLRTLQFRTRRKSAVRRYQLTQFLQGALSSDELSQAWDLLDDLGVNQSPLLPPPSD